jgi:hypothetical protein
MSKSNVLQTAALIAAAMSFESEQPKRCQHGVRTDFNHCWLCNPPLAIPDKLDINTDHVRYCMQFDVYFNGEKQTRCIVADVKNGRILRYKHAIGRTPVRNRRGKYDTETLEGVVKIVRKDDAASRSDTSAVT